MKLPHIRWDRDELRYLMFLQADKGPIKAFVHHIGKPDDRFCGCGKIQNAAHLLDLRCVGAMRRKWEDIWTDREFRAGVTDFLRSQGRGGQY